MKIVWLSGNGSRVNVLLHSLYKNTVNVRANCSISLNGWNCTAAPAYYEQVYLCDPGTRRREDVPINPFSKSSNCEYCHESILVIAKEGLPTSKMVNLVT